MSTSLIYELLAEREAKITEHFTKREAKITEHFTEREAKIMERFTEREAKNKAESEAKSKAEMIIRILSHRLELPSRTLQDKIISIRNLEKLDELADFALTCISLDEFATALK